jgi:hypothetical protein
MFKEYPDYLPPKVKRDLQEWEWHKEDLSSPPESLEGQPTNLDLLFEENPLLDRESIDYKQLDYVAAMRLINEVFLKWRDRVCRHIYKRSRQGNMQTPTEEGLQRYLKETGENPSSYRGVPEFEYFTTHILPAIQSFAQTPEQLVVAGLDCIEILENLMVGEISYTTHTTQRSLLTRFFQNTPDDDDQWRWRDATGQFQEFYLLGRGWEQKGRRANPLVIKGAHRDNFYKMIMGPDQQALLPGETRQIGGLEREQTLPPETQKRREIIEYLYYESNKWLTLAIAKHQGWECDRHYDGGDYTNSTREIEEKFKPIYEALPLHVRPLVFKAFVKYGGHYHSMAFLNGTREVARHFIEKEQTHLLLAYYMIVQSAPEMTLGQASGHGSDRNKSDGFPVLEPEEALSEMIAFEKNCGDYPLESIDLARKMIEAGDHSRRTKPSFKLRTKRGNRMIEEPHSIPATVKKMQKQGYEPADVKKAMSLLDDHPWLRENAKEIFENYAKIDKNFPGGVDALIAYLKKISASNWAMSRVISACKQNNLPQKNLQKWLDLGEEVITKLEEHGTRYFQIFNTRKEEPLIQMVENDWEEFEKITREFLELTLTFPNEDKDRETVFESLIRHHKDPRFEEWKEILIILRDQFVKYLEVHGKTHPYKRSVKSLSEPIGHVDQALWVISEESKREMLLKRNQNLSLPPDVDMQEQAKLVSHMTFDEGDSHGFHFNNYIRLILLGMHPKIAARARVKGHVPSNWGDEDKESLADVEIERYVDIPALPCPLGKRKFKEVRIVTDRVRILVDKLLKKIQTNQEKSPGGFLPSPLTDKTSLLSDKDLLELSTDQLNQELRKMEALEKDPKVAKYINFKVIREKVNKALSLLAMRRTLAIPSSYTEYEPPLTPDQKKWLENTNPATRTAITGMTMLGAFGALSLEDLGIEDVEKPEKYEGLLLLPDSSYTTADKIESKEMEYRRFVRANAPTITGNIGKILPELIQAVEEARLSAPGKMAIGGKIHTPRSMDYSTIEAIRSTFGIRSTPFRLIHANDTLVLPPMASSFELKLLIKLVEMTGGLNGIKDPEIQFAMGGRLPEEIAGLVGATSLLGTNRGRRFKEGAFKTTHDNDTGARIMAYDAGVLDNSLPFHLPGAKGRTDRLGCQILSDADIIQTLGTLGTHTAHKGRFTPQWKRFREEMLFVLDKLNLTRHLRDADWILDPKNPDDTTLDKHEGMVRKFTDTWWRESEQVGFGAIMDVQDVILRAHESIERQSARILKEEPDEVEKLMTY